MGLICARLTTHLGAHQQLRQFGGDSVILISRRKNRFYLNKTGKLRHKGSERFIFEKRNNRRKVSPAVGARFFWAYVTSHAAVRDGTSRAHKQQVPRIQTNIFSFRYLYVQAKPVWPQKASVKTTINVRALFAAMATHNQLLDFLIRCFSIPK